MLRSRSPASASYERIARCCTTGDAAGGGGGKPAAMLAEGRCEIRYRAGASSAPSRGFRYGISRIRGATAEAVVVIRSVV